MSALRTRWLALAPAITAAAFLLPIGAGLLGTLLPAMDYLPALGRSTPGLGAWRELFAYPGFASSFGLMLFTGVLAATLSVALAVGFCAWAWGRPHARRIGAVLAPILATPHSALAIGLAFLILPSGWIVRALSPWLTGWATPPDVSTVGDPSGLAIVLGLLVKEVPYLTLMIVGALNQVPARAQIALARSLGYSPAEAWIKTILPQIYPQIRMPVYAVLAFSLSVVDVALILGPGNPPPLSVLALRWFSDPDLARWFPAAAAATLQLAVVIASIAAWYAGERIVAAAGRRWIERGERVRWLDAAVVATARLVWLLIGLAALALAGMALWSFATQWRFPDALPEGVSLMNWMRRLEGLADPAARTLVIGLASTAIALALVLACLENEHARAIRPRWRALWLIYLPLVIPQIAFLFGLQVVLIRSGFDGTLAAVVWAHLVFVLPYVFLTLSDPWRAFDTRYARTAASLGASPARIFFRVKMPILLRPTLIAGAVGFAVSVGLYLPTLFAGNGRVATLTTEAVTLAAGADRRVIGAFALVQALFPMLAYLVAAWVPAWLHANRRGIPRWG